MTGKRDRTPDQQPNAPRTPTTWRPEAAFVLAAGMGSRMRHLTTTVPKPMVRLNGIPLIDRVLGRIADAGIATAIVNVHYRADVLEAHLAQRGAQLPRIVISDERDKLLDTGGGVLRALTTTWPQLCAGPFLIHNSDSVWVEGVGQNLARLCANYDSATMDALLLLAPTATSLGYDGNGDFQMDAAGRLTRRASRDSAPFVFAGASIAHPRMFEGVTAGAFSLNRLWNRAADEGRLYGVRLDGIWMHVGTPEAVIEAERQLDLEDAP